MGQEYQDWDGIVSYCLLEVNNEIVPPYFPTKGGGVVHVTGIQYSVHPLAVTTGGVPKCGRCTLLQGACNYMRSVYTTGGGPGSWSWGLRIMERVLKI